MDNAAILSAVQKIMQEYFDEDDLVVTRETTADEVPQWDSMNHINIIIAIEQHFKIKFLTSEVEGLHNVGSLVDLIARKTGNV